MKIEALPVQPIPEADAPTRALAKARARAFGQFVGQIPFAAALLDRDLTLVACSREWARQGIAPGLTLGGDAGAGGLVAFEDVGSLLICAEAGIAFSRYLPTVDAEGVQHVWRTEFSACRDGPPGSEETYAVMITARDVTGYADSVLRAERDKQRLTMALELDDLLVREYDLRTKEVYFSGHAPELQKYCTFKDDPLEIVDPEDRQRCADLVATRKIGEARVFEFKLHRDDGVETWVRSVGKVFVGADGKPEKLVNLFKDITDRRRQTEAIETLAFKDPLTGLPNRALFQHRFQEAVTASETLGEMFGLIMIDVDHFKDINDTLGHDAGDALLKRLAGMLQHAFRAGDTVARLGGDEFAVILRGLHGEADMLPPIAKLQDLLRRPIEHAGRSFTASASIGAALHGDPDADPSHMIKNADIALYRAKETGRNRSIVFEPSMRSEVEQRIELLRDVRAALTENEFTLYYQPVVDIRENKVAGFEALMRWIHPEQGVLTPARFMPAFEDQDLSLKLGDVAFEAALKQMRQWLDDGVEFGRVAVNISSAQFRSGRLAEEIQERLARWNVPCDRLTIEVTENVYMGWGSDLVSSTVRQLHDAGVMIALDDFGTGYASLANLRQFPIDRLKIDKSFVQNVEDEAIVKAVITLGTSMGMKVVAEGVEDAAQLKALEHYGCDQVQGYHFGRPMPAGEVAGFLTGFGVNP
ncbi:bifunctional diguanylate cyclase/phosphodiesterase [Caulobacter sp. FWC2]|uniref:putative bifunctional diguanylate cyclase/phosphodiesterase n=1 Tax=Caulobacter sp. FWC2 TaxID=69664 RepID=UPI000C14AA8D|nr:EAL domain-containing protein [Caulobacter sp. FWC2]PIB90572.1 GGDEF domain-containing protein [Caulobacter sp. FWC2]